jgi:hypothetical protein
MRSTAWLALLALAIQFALTFGHVHLDGGDVRSGWSPHALRWAMGSPPTPVDSPAVPARHKTANLADDFCTICSAMQLAYAPTEMPFVQLAAVVSSILRDPSGDLATATPSIRPFRARGPPHA